MPTKYKRRNSQYRNQPKSGKKKPPTGTDADLNLATLLPLFTNEDKAREFIESKRWPDGAFCPHCGCMDVYKLTAKPGSKKPVRPGVYKCSSCREQFAVTVGTIFEDSKLPLGKWLMAIHLMTSSKKGVSSHQIARELGITQKSAWFMCHRIREAMKLEPMAGMLKGTVEADETYVGGKARNRRKGQCGHSGRPNPETSNKTPVVVLVERNGDAVARPMPRLTAENIRDMVAEVVDKNQSRLMTDELKSYIKLGRSFANGHGIVKHKANQYVSGADHCNTAESFFALLKRGHYGIFHALSRNHLFRYCNEFAFRWKHRKVTDGERMVSAIEGAEGKRLMYKEPINLAR